MKIELECSMCGKSKTVTLEPHKIDGEMTLHSLVLYSGWIGQLNHPHFDIYCSPRCAA